MLHVSLERVQSQKKSVVQLPHVLIYLLSLCLVLETSMWHIEHIHVRIWIECLGVWEREDSFQISYFPTSMDFSHWFCHNKSLFEKFIPTKHPSEGSQCNHNQINMKPSNCKKMPNEKSLWMIFFFTVFSFEKRPGHRRRCVVVSATKHLLPCVALCSYGPLERRGDMSHLLT